MRRFAVAAAFAVAGGYILLITFLIWRTPEPGETTTQGLARAYQQVLADRDKAGLERLVHQPPGDEALDRLLNPAVCGDEVLAVQPANTPDGAYLSLVNRIGTVCARLPIADHDERWLIDPWCSPFHSPG